MKAIVITSIGTTLMYLIHRWRNLYFSAWFYIFAFALGLTLISMLGASEAPEGFTKIESQYDYQCNYFDNSVPCVSKSLTTDQRKKYTKKRDFSLKNAKRCEKEAADKCWWIPCIDDRQLTRSAVVTFLAGVTALSQKSGAIGMMLTALTEYSFSCIDEYYYINEKLQWSKYHYDNYEWYQYVLDNA